VKLFLITILLPIFITFSSFAIDKVIYGDDNRFDMNEYPNQLVVDMAHATAAQIDFDNMTYDKERKGYTLGYSPLKHQRGFCKDTRFLEQNSVGECTGFLISPTIMVTAGHCMTVLDTCSMYKWVFDYNQKNIIESEQFIPEDMVYSCKVIEYVLDRESKNDYAVVELDRPVIDRDYLQVRTSGTVLENTPLIVIGHPSGLPTKIADRAIVRDNSATNYLVANLDTFGGNSGSPVINEETGLVEGILVRGVTDYAYDRMRGCYINNVCGENECKGEEVTKITSIRYLSDYIPK